MKQRPYPADAPRRGLPRSILTMLLNSHPKGVPAVAFLFCGGSSSRAVDQLRNEGWIELRDEVVGTYWSQRMFLAQRTLDWLKSQEVTP